MNDLPVLISTHEPFVLFSPPVQVWRGSDRAALVGTWHLARVNPLQWLSPPSAYGIAAWRGATDCHCHGPWGSCSAAVPPLTWPDALVVTMNNTEAWESSGQVFPKMAKRTSGKEQVLKKNDVFELFVWLYVASQNETVSWKKLRHSWDTSWAWKTAD